MIQSGFCVSVHKLLVEWYWWL